MKIKPVIQIGLTVLLFTIFSQVNAHAETFISPYMPGNPAYPIIFEDHEDKHLDFNQVKRPDICLGVFFY